MKKQKKMTRRWWFWLLVFVLLAGGSGGYFYWQQAQAGKAQSSQAAVQTYTARRGDLTLTVSGSGTLSGAQTVELSFPVAGLLKELNVSVGDRVTTGQTLAVLDGMDELELSIKSLELELKAAQQALDNLAVEAAAGLSQAQIDLAEAQSAYAEARNNLKKKGDPRCDPTLTEQYYYEYIYASRDANLWDSYLSDGNTGYGRDYILTKLRPLKLKANNAYLNWKYCEGYTDQEIAESEAALAVAEAALKKAEASLAQVEATNGIDPNEKALDEAKVKYTSLQLGVARNNLSEAVMTAPIDGVVTAVTAQQGEQVGTGVLITLMDLDHASVQASIDESDLLNLTLGCDAVVEFSAVPDRTFNGKVTEIQPRVSNSGFTKLISLKVQLASSATVSGKVLPVGLDATVDLMCSQAKNAVIISLNALKTAKDGSYTVTVLKDNGERETRAVTVGLQTASLAEIKSGLQEGEKVIVNVKTTNSSQNTPQGQPGMDPGGIPGGAPPAGAPAGGPIGAEDTSSGMIS